MTDPVKPGDQILGAQVCVPFQHLHALVAAYGGHFLVVQAGLNETTDSFVTQVVKP